MISPLNEKNRDAFVAACDMDAVVGPDICTRLAVYGMGAREAVFWLAEDEKSGSAAAICLDNGIVKISTADGADIDELAEFLRVLSGWCRVQANAILCKHLHPALGGKLATLPQMRYTGGLIGGDYTGIESTLSLDELYGLIITSFPQPERIGRESWYVYTSHIIRHKLAHVVGIRRVGRLAVTGGIYGWNLRYGVIACLAVHPDFRGLGYGALITRYLCNQILMQGKIPVLTCAEENLALYYNRMGFEPCSRWGQMNMEGET